MHRHFRAIVQLCFALFALCSVPSLAATDAELRAVEETRREAIRTKDFAALGQIYSPSFVAIAGNGRVIDRDGLFKVFAATDPTLTFKTDEIQVLDHGDTAVFIGRLVAYSATGKQAFASRFSHVFVRQGTGWVCIAGQSTPLAAASAG